MLKIERRLFEVKFFSYIPYEVRERARKQGQMIDASAKATFGCKLWVPWPVDERDQFAPEKMPVGEHSVEWAMAEVRRIKPDGLEVLAFVPGGVVDLGIIESSIVNQPPVAVGEIAGATPNIADLVGGVGKNKKKSKLVGIGAE